MAKVGDRVLYYLILKPCSYLPLGVMYFLGHFVFFLAYRVLHYRRKVIRQNLKNAFPEKSETELAQIEKSFYKYFIDFLVESVKAISISKKNVIKRTTIKNPELIDKLHAQNKNLIVLCGHYSNWEFYSLTLPELVKYNTYSVYQPLKNKFFDNVLYNSRTRNGMNLIKTKETIPFFNSSDSDENRMVILVNDQSPGNLNRAYWNYFLNQETGWNFGPEKLARKYDYAVLFGYARRIKRGHYEVEFRPLSLEPSLLQEGQITHKYSMMLEELIRERPQFWLWSHRRWKHKRPTEVPLVDKEKAIA